MPNVWGVKFQKDEEGSLPDLEVKKEPEEEKKEEEKHGEEKEGKKEEMMSPEKEGEVQKEKDIQARSSEQKKTERVQPSTSRWVTPKRLPEPKGKPAVVYNKSAPPRDMPFKVKYGNQLEIIQLNMYIMEKIPYLQNIYWQRKKNDRWWKT